MSNIDRNGPFLPLYKPNNESNYSNSKEHVKDYVLTLSSYNNPQVFYFDDVFETIKSIEVIKSRIERSENTCEYYRNCPFITLFKNFPSFVKNSNIDAITNQLGISNLNASGLIEFLNDSLNNYSVKSFQYTRTFQYNYKISSLSTLWWQSPDLWDSYINSWYLSNLWGSFNLGLAPFVLDTGNYSLNTLVSTLNDINNAYFLQMQDTVPFITTSYNSDLNRLYFYSTTAFFLFPSNACEVVGLRADSIYVSQFNYTTNYFMIYADHPPKLTGSDVIYIQNDESQSSLKNSQYSVLSTIYLLDNTLYPYDNNENNNKITREIQMIN